MRIESTSDQFARQKSNLSHTVDMSQTTQHVWSREICVVSREKLACKSYNWTEEKLVNNVPKKTCPKNMLHRFLNRANCQYWKFGCVCVDVPCRHAKSSKAGKRLWYGMFLVRLACGRWEADASKKKFPTHVKPHWLRELSAQTIFCMHNFLLFTFCLHWLGDTLTQQNSRETISNHVCTKFLRQLHCKMKIEPREKIRSHMPWTQRPASQYP
jgi:hypothetical protein